ncbi:MAG: TlyA family RNA methyltransferase [Halanaerobiaceae bacterium]
MSKMKLIKLLLKKGLFKKEREARGWIMAGKVYVDDNLIDKPGTKVEVSSEVSVHGLKKKYVGKGGYKLEGALNDFDIKVKGKVVIDAGASTGGFTDCLIQKGVEKVYAVDAGYGQLMGKLRKNERVVNMEKVNISDNQLKKLDPRPSLATVDLSYLSLKKAIPIFSRIIKDNGEMICLVKPLFEVDNAEIRRTGNIKNPETYKNVLLKLVDFVIDKEFSLINITHSPIKGSSGTREFFLRISKNKDKSNLKNIEDKIEKVVQAVLNI